MRMCVGCREMKPKRELIRFVCSPEGDIKRDITLKAAGRGAYICPNRACLERALKTRALERALDHPLDENVASKLREELPENG